MSDSVDRVFVHALNTVKRIPRTGTARPPTAERLKLYGLYKQSMEGDVEGIMDRPIGNTTDVYAECEKWDAWFAQRGLSRTEAKRRYISTLIETMHRYASQTPEARELVAELEFVWDQIKANTSSGSGSGSAGRGSALSSPVRPVVVPASPQRQPPQRSYASIGGRLAQPAYEDMVAIANASANARGDMRGDSSSRLRVLSPVSQPDGMYQRRGSGMRIRNDDEEEEENPEEEEEEDDEEEEEYEEAQDTLYEDDDDNNDPNHQHTSDEDSQQQEADYNEASSSSLRRQQHQHGKNKTSPSPPRGRKPTPQKKHPPPPPTDTRRWRRRVEQALTKMTAEVAAVREQMEVRAIHHRRRSSAWAWLKWLAWVTLRQVIWDLAILGMLLIWMRIKGDRRVEERLRAGWVEVKGRLGRVRSLRRVPGLPLLP